MKKYSIVSVSGIVVAVASIILGTSSVSAATSITNAVGLGVNANVGNGIYATTSVGVTTSTSTNTAATYTNANQNNQNNTGVLNASINIDSDDQQLNAYAQSIAENDASVSAISTTNNNVSMSYKVPVRLFGFIPAYETETATVDTSSGSTTPQVSVHRSWWSFLAAGNNSSDASTFSANLNDRLGAGGTAFTQADIMASIEAAAQQSSVSNRATASANASTGSSY